MTDVVNDLVELWLIEQGLLDEKRKPKKKRVIHAASAARRAIPAKQQAFEMPTAKAS
ncbi:hypothetical protein H4W30_007611 [Amycolatopsis roodepoortensis]|uniref:Transposase n=2 Tax=Amycolatopsis roodepoortensis TaxID=700274 RepID=A0ABR9LJ71_9PSEU|nr:hypothetical protein [Amycolatopsis roodepoortensis]MBE1580530.1 hypothetical protein [Amycolatopsis roodepoortensis]